MNKKAQVTVYLILGLVLVMSFLIIIYLVGSATTEKLGDEERRVLTAALEASAVNYYAQICLDNALEEGLILMGRQGGVIYTDQGGITTKDTNEYSVQGDDLVKYGVKKGNILVPNYPCPDLTSTEPDYCRYPQSGTVYLFGVKTLPALEGDLFSIQGQLQHFIENYVQDCVNELVSNGTFGVEIEPADNINSTTVVFSEKATLVKMEYPLKVRVGGREPIVQYLHWTARADVRFKVIWEMVNDFLNDDVVDAEFNLDADDFGADIYDNTRFLPNYFFGKGVKISELKGENDIFILNDTSSQIDGEPYIFKFARQNRPPALKWIHKDNSSSDLYDYLVVQGDNISMVAEANDPDEDNLTYSFFDSGNLVNAGEVKSNIWNKSTVNINAGYYNVTVKAEDEYGLYDSQKVRILIDNKLNVDFDVKSYYELEYNSSWITKEDPIILDASQMSGSLDPDAVYYYVWQLLNISQDKCVILPDFVSCSAEDFDIENISSRIVNQLYNNGFRLDGYIQYNDALIQQESKEKTETFHQCVPYRNSQHPFSYPYHNYKPDGTLYDSEIDPFLSDHACCTENGTFELDTTECFSKIETRKNNGVVTTTTNRQFCSGNRGNICGGRIVENSLSRCSNETSDSNLVSVQCKDKIPWSRISSGVYCYGNNGCKYCDKELVDVNNNQVIDAVDACGCSASNPETSGADCDINFNGGFEGRCVSNTCAKL